MPLPFYAHMFDTMNADEFLEFQKKFKNLTQNEKNEFLKNAYKNFKKKDWKGTQQELDDWIEKVFQK